MKRSTRQVLFLYVLLCTFVGLSLLALGGRQQRSFAVVTGTIAEAASMKPLAGEEVTWNAQKVRSDEAGHYQISIPVGIRGLSFSAPGHRAVHKVLMARSPAAL